MPDRLSLRPHLARRREEGGDHQRAVCTGCGTCVATCPCNAINQFGFTDDEVKSEILALLARVPAAATA